MCERLRSRNRAFTIQGIRAVLIRRPEEKLMDLDQWLIGWGISWEQIIALAVIAVILVVGWTAMRVAFKLTAALFRAGCVLIVLLMAGVFVASMFLF
jgi:hypothetical protein